MIGKTIQSAIGAITLAFSASFAPAAVTVGLFELNADQEVPASTSVVVGHGEFSYNDTSNRLTLLLQFVGAIDLDGLQTAALLDDLTGLHVHSGAPGTNGGVVYNLLADPGTLVDAPNNRVLSIWDENEGNGTTLLDQLPDFIAGNLYVNVHTQEFPAGAVRGQIVVPEPSIGGLVLCGAMGFLLRRIRRS